MFTDPIPVEGSLDQEIMMERNWLNRPCRVDRLYLFHRGDVYLAAALYMNFENRDGGDPAIMETMRNQLLALRYPDLEPPYSSILSLEMDEPVGSIIVSTDEHTDLSRTSGIRDLELDSFPPSEEPTAEPSTEPTPVRIVMKPPPRPRNPRKNPRRSPPRNPRRSPPRNPRRNPPRNLRRNPPRNLRRSPPR